MGQIRVVTDSTADLSAEQVEKYGIKVVPLVVNFGDQAYIDGIDLKADRFYEMLTEASVLPKTSQPSPEDFRRLYEELAVQGDPIFSVHVSGKLSGTLNSAELAAKEVPGEIHLVDTKNASQGIGLTALVAAEGAKRGLAVDDLKAILQKSVEGTFSVFAVETLEFLQRNGRIGKAASLLGSLLQIKPILYADPEGMVAPYGKVRGRSKVIPTIVEAALKNVSADKPVNLSVVHSNAADRAQELLAALKEHYDVVDLHVGIVGPAIGANIGPGAVGVMLQPSFETLLKM